MFKGIAAGLLVVIAFAPAAMASTYEQGFETDNNGWVRMGVASNGYHYGNTATRVASGSNGIASASGDYHVELTNSIGDPYDSPGYADTLHIGGAWGYPNAGEYPSTFVPYTSSVDIYVDSRWDSGSGFDLDAYPTYGNTWKDFIFHVGKQTSDGRIMLWADANSNYNPQTWYGAGWDGGVELTGGWYTFEHSFYNNGGVVNADMTVYDAQGDVVFTALGQGGEPGTGYTAPIDESGEPSKNWLAAQYVTIGGAETVLALDNIEMVAVDAVPEPITLAAVTLGLAGLGRYTRRRIA